MKISTFDLDYNDYLPTYHTFCKNLQFKYDENLHRGRLLSGRIIHDQKIVHLLNSIMVRIVLEISTLQLVHSDSLSPHTF